MTNKKLGAEQGRVTSLTGGHTAQFEDLGDQMIITIFQEQAKLKRGGRGCKEMNVEALKCRVNMLHRLLEAPEPGLATWNMAVEHALKDIVDFAGSPAATAVCKCEQIHVDQFGDSHTQYAVAILGLDPWKTDTSNCEIHSGRGAKR